MNTTITAKVASANDETKKYAEEKAEKFEKFCKLRKVEIILDKESENFKVDVFAAPEHGSAITASSKGETWNAAIDSVADKVEKQLQKLKEKKKSHRIKKAQPKRAEGDEEEETYGNIVDKMKND